MIEYQHRNVLGQLHNESGPAINRENGYQAYYHHGVIHRSDGPARIHQDGTYEYWINGEIPLVFSNTIITKRPMVFKAEVVPEVLYDCGHIALMTLMNLLLQSCIIHDKLA